MGTILIIVVILLLVGFFGQLKERTPPEKTSDHVFKKLKGKILEDEVSSRHRLQVEPRPGPKISPLPIAHKAKPLSEEAEQESFGSSAEPKTVSNQTTPVGTLLDVADVEFSHAYYSTTALGKIIGLEAKSIVFGRLVQLGYISRLSGKYVLTELGQSPAIGGRYRTGKSGDQWVVWPFSLGEKLLPMKSDLLGKIPFKLYHMTHVKNLPGISKDGILAHNSVSDNVNISNRDVNDRRIKKDPIHKQSLHQYVPMYFNCRNAMLYQKQKEHGDRLVVLEIDTAICLQPHTIFSDRNAAAAQSNFVYCPSHLAEIEWEKIRAREWVKNGVTLIDIKQAMMAECLVKDIVPAKFIKKVHLRSSTLPLSSASSALFDFECNSPIFFT